jgi:phosphotransferase system enzyme I (PtsI)
MQIRGIGASPGYAVGQAVILHRDRGEVPRRTLDVDKIDAEIERFRHAVERVAEDLEHLAEQARRDAGEEEAKIFSSQMLLLQDPEFAGAVERGIREQKVNAEAALAEVTELTAGMFRDMDDPYLRDRASDIVDVSRRIMNGLLGVADPQERTFDGTVILVADDLTPSEAVRLKRCGMAGLAVEFGSQTSHAAIIARSLGIPAVVAAKGILSRIGSGDELALDGNAGIVHVRPERALVEQFRVKQEAHLLRQKQLEVYRHRPTLSADGVRLETVANIAGPEDAWNAKRAGAEGVGLYRTEFLFMGKPALPDEEEQFQAYKVVTEIFGPEAPIVIRTLDIGGDKELPQSGILREANPFLGHRAIRWCLQRPDVFKTQLRAILRASHYGNVKLMYPMISTLQEWREANRLLSEAKRELDERCVPYNDNMEIGIMIEVPSAALMADRFAREVDFFSIGTNDLVQYTMAADRMNEKVAHLSDPFQPAVIRLLWQVISAAQKKGKWVGMCGEMAGNPLAIPLLAGMGLHEFSVHAGAVLAARALIARLRIADLATLVDAVLDMERAEDIAAFIRRSVPEIEEAGLWG